MIRKTKWLIVFVAALCSQFMQAQNEEWMTSLEIAQRLARRQNKMILMVWEDATTYALPVLTKDNEGQRVFVDDMFAIPQLKAALWEYFVPVVVNENMYGDLFNAINGKRSRKYIDWFNDDSLKIMDANGNILAVSGPFTDVFDLDGFVNQYSIDTSFLSAELDNYAESKDFYTTFYLASKNVDFGIFVKKNIRKEILKLAGIYINESQRLLTSETEADKDLLAQRISLLNLKSELILGKSNRVLRALKKMKADEVENNNKGEIAFLYYTSHLLNKDRDKANEWKNEVSSLNLKKAQLIININK